MHAQQDRPTLRLPNAPSRLTERGEAADLRQEVETLRRRLAEANEELIKLHERAHKVSGALPLGRRDFLVAVAKTCRAASVTETAHVLARVELTNLADLIYDMGEDVAEDAMEFIGRALGGHIRGTDRVGRLGPGTFGVVLAHADRRGAAAKMARLTAKVEETFHLDRHPGCQIFLTHDVTVLQGDNTE